MPADPLEPQHLRFLVSFSTHIIQKYAGIICIAICVGYLIVGLWPFNFWPRNTVEWLPGENGLHFRPHSIVYSEDGIELDSPAGPPAVGRSVSIELMLTSEVEARHKHFSVLSFYDGRVPEDLLVAQWRFILYLRVPLRKAAARDRYQETGIHILLPKEVPRFITITSDAAGTSSYVNGVLLKAYPLPLLRPDNLRGRLILGSSPEGGSSWTGKLLGLALYNRALGASDVLRHYQIWNDRRAAEIAAEPGITGLYLFDEGSGRVVRDHSLFRRNLQIPEFYHVLRKTVLRPPWKESLRDASELKDIAVNILGFVPFGFFYFVYRTGRRPGHGFANAGLTVVVAAAISAAIELAQVFLPSRSSQLTDLICNVAGGVVGMIAASAWALLARRGPMVSPQPGTKP